MKIAYVSIAQFSDLTDPQVQGRGQGNVGVKVVPKVYVCHTNIEFQYFGFPWTA